MSDGRYIVCLAAEGKHNPLTLGPLVQEYAEMTRVDARRAVIRGRGLLADGLTEQRAQGLIHALRNEGVEAFAVQEAAAPSLRESVRLHRVGLAPDGLRMIVTMRDRPVEAPWSALAAAVCTEARPSQNTGGRTYKDTVFVPGAGVVTVQKHERSRPKKNKGVTATIALKNSRGDVRAFDFSKQSADYGFLGDGLQPTQAANFGLFLQELSSRAPDAFCAAGYRSMACGDRRAVPRVNGPAERMSYLRWALCCAVRSGMEDS